MRCLRSRASIFAGVALTWQIVALIFVPAAACREGLSSATSHEMANCPMHHETKAVECPVHSQAEVAHDCHCPRLGCSQTDNGFLELLGPIGVIPAAAAEFSLHQTGNAVSPTTPSSISLAPVPISPPPRV
jgi:hypothetical protein